MIRATPASPTNIAAPLSAGFILVDFPRRPQQDEHDHHAANTPWRCPPTRRDRPRSVAPGRANDGASAHPVAAARQALNVLRSVSKTFAEKRSCLFVDPQRPTGSSRTTPSTSPRAGWAVRRRKRLPLALGSSARTIDDEDGSFKAPLGRRCARNRHRQKAGRIRNPVQHRTRSNHRDSRQAPDSLCPIADRPWRRVVRSPASR
jgi:hypothetical protein